MNEAPAVQKSGLVWLWLSVSIVVVDQLTKWIIVNQFALFSLMSSPSASMDGWLQEHPHLCRRVTVPAELKWEVRDKLDQANVSERTLFPGLDGLSRWLERYYAPRV